MKRKPLVVPTTLVDASNVEFEVWQDGMMVASCSGPEEAAKREALHYAAQYEQDGPIELYRVDRTHLQPNS